MDSLQQGRSAFLRHAWADSCLCLEAADHRTPLQMDDLERLAVATYLVGRELDSTRVWTRSFHAAREQGEHLRAVRSAFWVAFVLLNRGDLPASNGWVGRGRRVLEESGDPDVVERGYLGYLAGLQAIFGGDAGAAREAFEGAASVGEHFRDRDLATLSGLGLGRALIRLRRLADGLACLDEAMVAVSGGEVSPIVVGDAYCTAIDACREIFDLSRARTWTQELTLWCDRHADLVAFRGQCLLHRSELLQSRGAWQEALEQARQACRRLSRPTGQLATGAAHYQQGELHRLRGEFDDAEAAYAEARRHGREPQPGLAMLRLAQGDADAAAAAIRRGLAETGSPWSRSRLLPAAVEVLIAVDATDEARAASSELDEIADEFNSRMLDAVAAQLRGTVDLAAGEPGPALPSLRRALELWQQLEVPHEVGRVRVLIGQACRQLGDDEAATSEWETARTAFADLEAAPDLAGLDRLMRGEPAPDAHGLSPRELEVLRSVASGRTNRQIAAELVISERTVDRHVSNILTKLGVTSRTAAAAFAYEAKLV
ncbi:MAG TPA: LuxR C-terminal-related transcriptional regulator [Nitriliruptorales bacterium]